MAKPKSKKPLVAIIMGSQSDWSAMQFAAQALEALEIPFEKRVISAHRTPDFAFQYARSAEKRGLKCIIAGAGMAAHLAGVVAGLTHLPVLGVPMRSKIFEGLDALLAISQMPGGIPVATFGVGEEGAVNAAIFAAQMLAIEDKNLAQRVEKLIKSLKK